MTPLAAAGDSLGTAAGLVPAYAVPCCHGRSGEGTDHEAAVAVGMLVVGGLLLAVVGYGLLRFLGWRSERSRADD